ncbi:SDR family oxidoreductase [Saccharothrix sp. Mg75]|uniref:SDR family oxidoreductase n=1 Tax=Saccharothrix sp. Mg75 TaxID=3445357 RepID=UPI003EEA34AA
MVVAEGVVGKRVLVTGGTTGIGWATARAFLASGAEVVVTGRDAGRLDRAVEELGGEVHAVLADQAVLADLDRLAVEVRDRVGHLDVLVANAGISRSALLGEVTPEAFDEEVAVNFRGTFFTVQRLAPLLADGASVVLVGSCLDQRGALGQSVYAATKAAVGSLARSFAAELRDRGIRVNSVAPGPTSTPMFDKYGIEPGELAAMKEVIARDVPLGRLADPDDIASAVLFLASPASSYVTAEQLTADGGWTRL